MAALEFPDPAFGDLVDRNGIDEVQLFPALPLPGDESSLLENREMLGDGLARHVQPRAKLAERLAVLPVQSIQQLPAAWICQGVEHGIVIHLHNREPYGSLFIGNRMVACQQDPATSFLHDAVWTGRIGRMAPSFCRIATVASLILAAGTAGAAEPPLAGCYERVYDAAHLAEHKGQLVVRMTISIAKTDAFDQTGPKPLIADGVLKVWLRGKDKSFDSIGACWAMGNNLACNGSLSAAETSTCKSRQDGLRDCRIDPGDAGGFKIEGKPDGVLVSIPDRLELLQRPYDGGPYLNFSSSNVENRAFLLRKTACQDSFR